MVKDDEGRNMSDKEILEMYVEFRKMMSFGYRKRGICCII